MREKISMGVSSQAKNKNKQVELMTTPLSN